MVAFKYQILITICPFFLSIAILLGLVNFTSLIQPIQPLYVLVLFIVTPIVVTTLLHVVIICYCNPNRQQEEDYRLIMERFGDI